MESSLQLEYSRDKLKIRFIPYTAVKVNDILISGKTDSDNLESIEKLFRVLKGIGAMVNKKKCLFFIK